MATGSSMSKESLDGSINLDVTEIPGSCVTSEANLDVTKIPGSCVTSEDTETSEDPGSCTSEDPVLCITSEKFVDLQFKTFLAHELLKSKVQGFLEKLMPFVQLLQDNRKSIDESYIKTKAKH